MQVRRVAPARGQQLREAQRVDVADRGMGVYWVELSARPAVHVLVVDEHHHAIRRGLRHWSLNGHPGCPQTVKNPRQSRRTTGRNDPTVARRSTAVKVTRDALNGSRGRTDMASSYSVVWLPCGPTDHRTEVDRPQREPPRVWWRLPNPRKGGDRVCTEEVPE